MSIITNVKPGYGFKSDKGKALIYSYTVLADKGVANIRFVHCKVVNNEIQPISQYNFNVRYPSVSFDEFKRKEKEKGVLYNEFVRVFSDLARDAI